MKLGFDVDGVLANFHKPYQDLFIQTSGRNLFPPELLGPGDIGRFIPVWDWPQYYGYTTKEAARVWACIEQDPDFWKNLPALSGMGQFSLWYRGQHDIYFVTDRPGILAKTQTETWLRSFWIRNPTVLITPHKADIARALGLDAYIDDRYANAFRIARDSDTQSFLLSRPYNAVDVDPLIKRVNSVQEFLDWVDAQPKG